jgi:hypothetical protein
LVDRSTSIIIDLPIEAGFCLPGEVCSASQAVLYWLESGTLIALAQDLAEALHNACAELARFLQVPQAGFAILLIGRVRSLDALHSMLSDSQWAPLRLSDLASHPRLLADSRPPSKTVLLCVHRALPYLQCPFPIVIHCCRSRQLHSLSHFFHIVSWARAAITENATMMVMVIKEKRLKISIAHTSFTARPPVQQALPATRWRFYVAMLTKFRRVISLPG